MNCAIAENNPYYISHHEATEKMLEQGQFQKAVGIDGEILGYDTEGGDSMRELYLSSDKFQIEFPKIIIGKINAASSKEEIKLISDEVGKIKKFKIIDKVVASNIEKQLIKVMRDGNKSGLFDFILSDQEDYLGHISDEESSGIILNRTISWVERKKGNRADLLSSISDFLGYYSEDKLLADYITKHANKMRITQKEFREHFIDHIPNLNKVISKRSKVKIYVETYKISKHLKDLIHASISDNSYSFETTRKPRKDVFKLKATLNKLTSNNTSSAETKRIPMAQMGGSAISRIIMAAKDVAGRNSTLIYNVNTKQLITDYEIKLCLKSPKGSEKCDVLKNTISVKKAECFSPRLLRDNGQTIKISHYPIPRIERKCLEENKKNLKEMMNISIADSVSNKLMQFRELQ